MDRKSAKIICLQGYYRCSHYGDGTSQEWSIETTKITDQKKNTLSGCRALVGMAHIDGSCCYKEKQVVAPSSTCFSDKLSISPSSSEVRENRNTHLM
ncbi:hypothetical protein OIU76_003539 [Salix suchowensis]|nr:hypothetical protein OIU76_003539 [Salix suchowensis]